jgi:putative membrane protein
MFIGPLLLIGLIILAVWYIQQQQQRDAPGTGLRQDGTRALEIVRERYARGEISRAEYEQLRRDLQ